MLRVLAEALLHLHAQLARRRQDQRARALRPVEQAIDDRQRERGGFAGAGLREPHDVAPFQRERNGFALNRCRRGVSRVTHRLQYFRRKPELVECPTPSRFPAPLQLSLLP